MYDFQRKIGHERGLKATNFVSPSYYGDRKIIDKCIYDRYHSGD